MSRNTQRPRFSLHTARKPHECEVCANIISVGSEWWRGKGRWHEQYPRALCVWCHELFGFPDDGWEVAPDGRDVMSAAAPSKGHRLENQT